MAHHKLIEIYKCGSVTIALQQKNLKHQSIDNNNSMQSTSYIPGYQLTPYSLHILTACVHYMSQQYLIVHILPVSMGPRYFMIANKLVSYIYNTIILQDQVVTLRCDQQINCFFSNFCKTKHYYNYILYLSLFNSPFRLIYNSNYHLNLSN